jgi:hypothetical protein
MPGLIGLLWANDSADECLISRRMNDESFGFGQENVPQL